eukprot:7388813-Prymnesium_polylepis.2
MHATQPGVGEVERRQRAHRGQGGRKCLDAHWVKCILTQVQMGETRKVWQHESQLHPVHLSLPFEVSEVECLRRLRHGLEEALIEICDRFHICACRELLFVAQQAPCFVWMDWRRTP